MRLRSLSLLRWFNGRLCDPSPQSLEELTLTKSHAFMRNTCQWVCFRRWTTGGSLKTKGDAGRPAPYASPIIQPHAKPQRERFLGVGGPFLDAQRFDIFGPLFRLPFRDRYEVLDQGGHHEESHQTHQAMPTSLTREDLGQDLPHWADVGVQKPANTPTSTEVLLQD